MAVIESELRNVDNLVDEFNCLLFELAQQELGKQRQVVRRFPDNVLALHRMQVLVEGIKNWEACS